MKKKKIGILGGTFNPIHNGHLILAEYAYEEYQLEKVIFMPSNKPPHKDNNIILSNEHRMNMIHFAIKDNPHFISSNFEYNREGTTFTADTLTLLNQQFPNTEYYFIIGADSLFQFETWKSPDKILSLCHLVAAVRDLKSMDEMSAQVALLNKKYDSNITLLHSPNIEISSSSIRERIKNGNSIKYFVPDDVINYINHQHLYQ